MDRPKLSKTDGLLIAAIVMIVVAAIFFIIMVSILFQVSGKDELSEKRGQLQASAALAALSVPMAIITAIVGGILYSRISRGKNRTNNLAWTATILLVLTILFIIISATIAFVTANQIDDTNSGDARTLRAVAGLGLIGFVIMSIAFFLIVFRGYKTLSKEVRTQRRSNIVNYFRPRQLNSPGQTDSLPVRFNTEDTSIGDIRDTIGV